MNKNPLIIDCDPGVDDSYALVYALAKNEVSLITSSCGNVDISTTTNNVCHLMDLLKCNIPVARGVALPLKIMPEYAGDLHGAKGLGGYTYDAAKNKTQPIKDAAPLAIFNQLKKNFEAGTKTIILCLGPMTNIAILLRDYPCREYIESIVFMGGSKDELVGIPYKEFNVCFDPDATNLVFKSGVPLVMVPMELGHFAFLDEADVQKVAGINKLGEILALMTTDYLDTHTIDLGAATHDSATAAIISDPQLFKTSRARLSFKYKQSPRGKIGYVDVKLNAKNSNATVALDMNIDDFKQQLYNTIAHFK